MKTQKASVKYYFKDIIKIIYLSFIVLTVYLFSCKDNRKKEEAAKVVSEWTGKEIRFPENTPCFKVNWDFCCFSSPKT